MAMKLDAICAKLKLNLDERNGNDESRVTETENNNFLMDRNEERRENNDTRTETSVALTENNGCVKAKNDDGTENNHVITDYNSDITDDVRTENNDICCSNNDVRTENNSNYNMENVNVRTEINGAEAENSYIRTENNDVRKENDCASIENNNFRTEKNSTDSENNDGRTQNDSSSTGNIDVRTENSSSVENSVVLTENIDIRTENSASVKNSNVITEDNHVRTENNARIENADELKLLNCRVFDSTSFKMGDNSEECRDFSSEQINSTVDVASELTPKQVVHSESESIVPSTNRLDEDVPPRTVNLFNRARPDAEGLKKRNRRKNFLPRFVQEVAEEEEEEEEEEEDVAGSEKFELMLPLEEDDDDDDVSMENDSARAENNGNNGDAASGEKQPIAWEIVAEEEKEEEVLDLRVDSNRSGSVTDTKRYNTKEICLVDSSGVIDLSINRVQASSYDKTKLNRPGAKLFLDGTGTKQLSEPGFTTKLIETSMRVMDRTSGRLTLDENLKGNETTCASDVAAMNELAVCTMNELLKIYGLREESDFENQRKKRFPIHPVSSGSLPWQQNDVMPGSSLNNSSGGSVVVNRLSLPSTVPDDVRVSYSSSELDLSKSSSSLSSSLSSSSSSSSIRSLKAVPVHQNSHFSSLHKGRKNHSFYPGVGSFTSGYPATSFSKKLPFSSKRISFKQLLPDYAKYAKRFNSSEDCNGAVCRDKGFKEHFHCTACTSRVYIKKEEMIRHFKWHKKREDSLQHGFLRYSPLDDCSRRFSMHCHHNGKHTHYHCLQDGCSKVYISTSDVQMHANYHRKDSAIIQEGFQRFRATENCAMISCTFAGQKTTHFHCRRRGCNFTFKNKADMEKHKTYHQKDEILTRDGFKKFMKYENCNYYGCRYSRVSNHIHCIRPGCNYVLHSTGQLYSHKRKHERHDMEQIAFKQLRPSPTTTTTTSDCLTAVNLPIVSQPLQQQQAAVVDVKMEDELEDYENLVKMAKIDSPMAQMKEALMMRRTVSPLLISSDHHSTEEDLSKRILSVARIKKEEEEDLKSMSSGGTVKGLSLSSNLLSKNLNDSLNLPIPLAPLPKLEARAASKRSEAAESASSLDATARQVPPIRFFLPKTLPPVNEKKERDESWKRYLTRYTANDPCYSRCQFLYKDHYHCNQAECGWLFRSKDGVREHAKFHEQQDRVSALTFMKYNADTKCTDDCQYYGKLEHYHCLWTDCTQVITCKDSVFSRLEHHKLHESIGRKISSPGSATSLDSMKRKRGRPPKFPKNDSPIIPKIEMSEEEIIAQAGLNGSGSPIANGFQKYESGQPCPDEKCVYWQAEHYHCVRPRCHHVTNRSDVLGLHAQDFHNFIAIADGFEFFDRNVNCRRSQCHNNQSNRHFHCTRPKCDYSFVRYSTMVQHERKHRAAEIAGTQYTWSRGLRSTASNSKTKSNFQSGSRAELQLLTTQTATSTATNGFGQVMVGGTSGMYIPVSALLSPEGQKMVISSSQVATALNPAAAPLLLTTLKSLPSVLSSQSQAVTPIMMAQMKRASKISEQELSLKLASSSPHLKLVSIAPKPVSNVISFPSSIPNNLKTNILFSSATTSSAAPLTLLLQQKTSNMPPVDWLSMKVKMHHEVHQNCGRPFCKLKKKDHYHCFDCNQAFSDPSRLKYHVARHGVSLEKLKEFKAEQEMIIGAAGDSRQSSTVVTDNTGSSEEEEEEDEEEEDGEDGLGSSVDRYFKNNDRMEIDGELAAFCTTKHITSNEGYSLTRADENIADDEDDDDYDDDDDDDDEADRLIIDLSAARHDQNDTLERTVLPSSVETLLSTLNAEQEDIDNNTSLLPNVAPAARKSHQSRKRKRTAMDLVGNVDGLLEKVPKLTDDLQSPVRPGQNKSLAAPGGFDKFRCNEDCGQERCAYRLSMTHYHCGRPDCGYSFCDHSRFLQHSERHRRIDVIMGDQFQQFHAKTDCGRSDCEYALVATHFHCLTCGFVCTDSSKVIAHRKHHTKMDRISEQGFVKVAVGEDCGVLTCVHRIKQTHYHCSHVGCSHIVMGPAQMAVHKAKHMSSSTKYINNGMHIVGDTF